MRQIQARKTQKRTLRQYVQILLSYFPMDEKRKTSRHTPYVQNMKDQDLDTSTTRFRSRFFLLDMKTHLYLVEISIFHYMGPFNNYVDNNM